MFPVSAEEEAQFLGHFSPLPSGHQSPRAQGHDDDATAETANDDGQDDGDDDGNNGHDDDAAADDDDGDDEMTTGTTTAFAGAESIHENVDPRSGIDDRTSPENLEVECRTKTGSKVVI